MRGKKPALVVKQRQARIFGLMRLRATDEQIVAQLKSEGYDATERTYRRDRAALKQQASEWIETFAKDGLVDEYQHAVESLKERVRRLVLAESQATTTHNKVEANIAIRDIELNIIELLIEGPTVWALKRKAQREGQAQIDKASQATGGHERTSAAASS